MENSNNVTSYNSSKLRYFYFLKGGTVISSNGKFTFNENGWSIEKHSGHIDNMLIDNISFNLSDVVATGTKQ